MVDEERPRLSMLDAAVLRRLFDDLETTDIDELELVVGSSRLFLRREPGVRAVVQERAHVQSGPLVEGTPVVAPLTGVYYSRPSPDKAPFVEPEDRVEVGQAVALIETMKLFNEVLSEVAGVVLSIPPADGDLVEAGQPLVYIRTGEQEDQ